MTEAKPGKSGASPEAIKQGEAQGWVTPATDDHPENPYRISCITKAIEPGGECRDDMTIFLELGKRIATPRNEDIRWRAPRTSLSPLSVAGE